jgi:hypothetical protein
MKTRLALSVLFSIVFVAALLTVAGCGSSSDKNTKKGKLTGQEVTMSLSDAVSGELTSEGIKPAGRVIITTDKGEEVSAYYPEDMASSLRGGQTLEIKKIKGSDEWLVTKILDQG